MVHFQKERLWIIFVIRKRPNLGGGDQGRFGKRSNFSLDFFTPSLTLFYVQQFPNIHLSHQVYTLLKSIRVKYEGRNRRCGNSFTCATVFKHHLSHQILYRAQINKSHTWRPEREVWKLFILKQDLCLVHDLQIYR